MEELPLGFKMAISHNLKAFSTFLSLDSKGQSDIIERAKQIKTKREMQIFVDSLPSLR